jgi:hypothetical protein
MAENQSGTKAKALNYVPRGIRNNNPLNIRKNGIKWKGQVENKDAFCVFLEHQWGWRAALIIICRTYRKRGLTTVWKIIHSWAPPSENKTDFYAKFVAFRSDVGLDTPLPSIYNNPDLYFKLLKNMAIMENGEKYVTVVVLNALKHAIEAYLEEFPENNKITNNK